ncbi:MAG: hypothetical protein COV31_02000 [Candidatus Yanofskybacteria bacterium CG10_big_fil_rev_8_21_14_0_10_46_23]|uniref:ASCH domain-containing protein n=1 Tax=Candidatus Yanofskybacteria bacterium CG10_big_fil_rev_8_21_14_0_10_46_23 TaxID=1975098 RepID=A0A2H0R3T4_9BACT|nr:MAG: hypothetical protein COV31_02000 [Candidatus Yanofskybacteria bacterium CG10_big_fil_rev_8_21_14_0_10_46_23]
MKTLKFKAYLVQPILIGQKTKTWRLFDDKDIQVADLIDFLNYETGETFARAEVLKVTEKSLAQIGDSDYAGQERYKNLDEMVRHYRDLYGDRVDLNTKVKIINFKLLR